MLRTLLSRKWLAALLVSALVLVAFVSLGRWQWGRYEHKKEQARLIESHYDAAPTPLDEALPQGAPLRDGVEWSRVRVTGRYDDARRQLVRNRPHHGVYGYEVLVPLRLPGGDAIVVDRGWVRNAERADVLPTVPPAPSGEVTVTGWLRPGERDTGQRPPAGQLGSIDLTQASSAMRTPVRGAYLVLQSEDDGSGAAPARPEPLERPSTDLGPHFAYALQWWTAAPLGFVLVGFYVRREYLESLGGDAPGPRTPARPRADRPKKVRIWDEEDA